MAYRWDSSLETGYELIDNQHKQLITAFNNLLDACRNGKGNEEVRKTLDFLTSYTIKHFSDEEILQKRYNYPDYFTQKQYHDAFKVTVSQLAEKIIQDGPTEEVIGLVSTSIGAWLLNHIKGDDFRMAAYIKAQGEGT
jgi:hemerythrin